MKERAEDEEKMKKENTTPNGKSNVKAKSPEKKAPKEEEPAKNKKSVKVPDDWKNAIDRLSQGGGPFADTFQALSKLSDVPTDSKKAFKVF